MADFHYEPIFQLGADHTTYDRLDLDVEERVFGSERFLHVPAATLTALAERAFADVSHLLRTSHLSQLGSILQDPEASPNDRFVAGELLRNAVIAAEGVFPSCQDTGTAAVVGWRGERVLTGGNDAEAFSRGIYNTFQRRNLRYSQLAPLTMYDEVNTKTNLPAQIDIMARGGSTYDLLFVAKGGGSANKFFLYQKSKAVLNPRAMQEFLTEAISSLGTAACPPYHLAVTIGGTSAEANLKTTKLASTMYYDSLPETGNAYGRAFRDRAFEAEVEQWARETGIGAQFGGKYFVHDVRVIRLPRHGASCPISIGVSCSADRNIRARISSEGVFLERLERDPARFLPAQLGSDREEAVAIDLNRPMDEIRATLSQLPVATRVMLNGPLIVARDVAHARLKEGLDAGQGLPEYFKELPVYYAGPAKTPDGHASGSFGPTTSQRMDPYVEAFQAAGGSLVMLGKGNRSPAVAESCQRYGGFYLGSIGGPAARLGRDCITKVAVEAFPELGMEAVWRIEVKDFPAFIITDDKGHDFFRRR